MKHLFEEALAQIKILHATHRDVMNFGNFPKTFDWANLPSFSIPAAELMKNDTSLATVDYTDLRDALISPWLHANWRETYRDTNIGEDFMSRFAYYELFGHEGHFQTQTMRGFLVYSDANLYYPWHHHPAEELYFIIAGEASFATEGNEAKLLKSGDTVFHESNQPHNMQTHESGLLAYVIWRNEFDTAPVLTDRLN